MASFARTHGLALRPHAKSHKSADIARAQLAAGAVGLCCAKLGEAEALAAEGIDDLHLTSPVVTAPAIARLAALAGRGTRLSVVADHPDAVDALAAALQGGPRLKVFVDIDPGIHRTGVASPDHAVALARRIRDRPSLGYGGVQFYCGAQQHIQSFAARRDAIVERTGYLTACLAALAVAGLPPAVVTGGGTGSHAIDAELGVLTELQAGSYIFMDREYNDCDLDGGTTAGFETSLLVDARVISANAPGLVTIDAG
jgi:D-serine deaminase-like pyridoxal phosphate-dependent protein